MGTEYVHALGQQLEACDDCVRRIELIRLLAASGSADAQPYLTDAVAIETDEDVKRVLREALSRLISP